jgi:hypothetical protein
MNRIFISVEAYFLDLYPQSSGGTAAGGTSSSAQTLRPLANGLALPSFWGRDEIDEAFAEANRIWIRGAEIEFSPIAVSQRSEAVPADERGMWIHFVNNLSPRTRGIAVGFVYDLPSDEGGWGGGRIAVIAGVKVWSGIAGFAGNLLAHELGHVLIDDPNHVTANNDPSNLMFGRRNPRVANAGLLNSTQVATARTRAMQL